MKRHTSAGVFSLLMVLMAGSLAAAPQEVSPRVVDLTAPDGTHLKASYFAAAKSGPGVLLLHQCNRQRKVWDDLAKQMAGAGLNVLTVDYRGYGESGGKPQEKLTDEERAKFAKEQLPMDVETAYQYLITQEGVNRQSIGVGGASCGVNEAIKTGKRHSEVKAMVLLSGNTDREGREYLRAAATLPVFVSAADDDGNTVEIMQWIYSMSTNAADKFVRYPAGGHGVEMFAAHPELPGAIVDWLVTNLKATGSGASSKNTKREPSIVDVIDEPNEASKAAEMYAQARKRDPKAVLFSEAVVNLLGYEHIQAGDTKGAIEIFKLNVLAYPNSPNVYDSLSDAYLADGQKELARSNAKKAIEIIATDTKDNEERRKGIKESAEMKLKQLGDAPNK